jgi:hypothetical protein
VFGKAVKAERQAVARAHGGDFKIDAVGGNADEFDVSPVHEKLEDRLGAEFSSKRRSQKRKYFETYREAAAHICVVI